MSLVLFCRQQWRENKAERRLADGGSRATETVLGLSGTEGFAHCPSLYGRRKYSRAKRGEGITRVLFACLVGWKEVRTPMEHGGAAGAGTHGKQEKINNTTKIRVFTRKEDSGNAAREKNWPTKRFQKPNKQQQPKEGSRPSRVRVDNYGGPPSTFSRKDAL